MKKFYTLLASIMLPWLVMAQDGVKSVPYTSSIGDATKGGEPTMLDEGWTTIDIDKDGSGNKCQWTNATGEYAQYCTSAGFLGGAMIYYTSSNPFNDWLVSPQIHLEAGKEYKVRLSALSNTSNEMLKVTYATGNTADALEAGKELIKDETLKTSKKFKKETAVFSVDATGDYYFGIKAYSPKNTWYIVASNFQVVENLFQPGTVTQLKAVAGTTEAPRALQVALSWQLPVVDADDAPLGDDKVVESVKIYRDNQLLTTLTGAQTGYVDTEATGLTSGYHTYGVQVTMSGAESAVSKVNTAYVGPVAPLSLPFTGTFTDAAEFELMWTVAKGDKSNHNSMWKPQITSIQQRAVFQFQSYESGNSSVTDVVEDEWLISPPIIIPEAGTYRVKSVAACSGKGGSYYGEPKLSIYYGTEANVSALTNLVVKDMDLKVTTNKADTDEQKYVFEITEPGTYYFAYHAGSEYPKNKAFYYYVYSLMVEQFSEVPDPVTNLQAIVDPAPSREVTLKWTNPATSATGEALALPYSIEISRNGETVKTLYNTPGLKEADTYTDEVPENGVYTYTVTPRNSKGQQSEQEAATVTTTWVGNPTVALPYTTEFMADDPTLQHWATLDADSDGKTWELVPGNGTDHGYYTLNFADNGKNEDYLQAPGMVLDNKYYAISLAYSGGGSDNPQAFTIGITDKPVEEDAKPQFLTSQEYTAKGAASEVNLLYKPVEPGTYYIVIASGAGTAATNYYRVRINGLSVEPVAVLPATARDVTATPAPDYQLAAVVNWTNPSETNIPGLALDKITKAVIYRDGEELVTLNKAFTPGQKSSYVDTEVTAPGHYTYSVSVYNDEGCSTDEAPTVTTAWIGEGLPIEFNDTEFADWSIYNVNNDRLEITDPEDGTLITEERTWIPYSAGLRIYSNDSSTGTDDWAVSPIMQLEPDQYYLVEVTSSVGSSYDPGYKWDLAVSPSDYLTDMTRVKTVTTDAKIASEAQTDSFIVSTHTAATNADDADAPITVAPGHFALGLYAYNLGAVSVHSVKVTPTTYSGIKDVYAANLKFAFDGNTLTLPAGAANISVVDLSGRVYLHADNAQSMNLSGLAKGVYIVSAQVNGNKTSVKIVK